MLNFLKFYGLKIASYKIELWRMTLSLYSPGVHGFAVVGVQHRQHGGGFITISCNLFPSGYVNAEPVAGWAVFRPMSLCTGDCQDFFSCVGATAAPQAQLAAAQSGLVPSSFLLVSSRNSATTEKKGWLQVERKVKAKTKAEEVV